MRPRILLLQARRADDPMKGQEFDCFVDKTGLPADRVVPHDLCEGPPAAAALRRFDAVMVGGSGDFYVSNGDLPAFEGTLDFLREVVRRRHPMLASCFGYQCLVQALGGEIFHDPENMEVGTYELTLTESGKADPLFGELPETFLAQLGHKDRAIVHPVSLPNLASSPRSPFQAFRIPGQPIWATQFHPELDRATNLQRFRNYIGGYAVHLTEEGREAQVALFRESPEASDLLRRFLKLVFG